MYLGRARYRPIDDRARYWANFFKGGKMNLENFQRGKKKKKKNVGIRTHAHSFNSPVQLPLAHRDTAEKVCFNHLFMIQLFLLLALTSPNPNSSEVLALALALTPSPSPSPSIDSVEFKVGVLVHSARSSIGLYLALPYVLLTRL